MRCLVTICLLLGLAYGQNTGSETADKYKQGHSKHGEAFDVGPRTKPQLMSGIGEAHFPISTRNAQVQKWFDQGVTLLHSFWDYEAERSFRWCLKLEPENAMVYWGLARAASDPERSKEFLAEAVKRKGSVTERERLYIEALEALHSINTLRDRGPTYRERNEEYKRILETISIKFPDDLEARALLALANMGDSRYGTEQIVKEVLTKQPDHPGAHHYRIHNWNHHEPEQALVSCKRYGAIAPQIGHAQHMPGHIYATVGMWHEAAISMDAATRTELRHMRDQMVFPFNYWNYGHNRNYLSYIQEQLGMAKLAIEGAKQLLDSPLDPKANLDHPYSNFSQGLRAYTRALIKFERWDELLKDGAIPWRTTPADKVYKTYSATRAYIGKGDRAKAEKAFSDFVALEKEVEKNPIEETYKIASKELKGRLELMRGESLQGLSLLSQAAQEQWEAQRFDNDPPSYPELLYSAVGREYLKQGSPKLAVIAFDKALARVRNDFVSLAGLVEAHHAMDNDDAARAAMARLLFVTSDADPGLVALERAKATGVKADPKDSSPAPQRNYAKVTLTQYGPALYEPYSAPALEALDQDKKGVTLDQLKGKNVILVFYLGRECLHCVNQLQEISKKNSDWERLNTVVLAVSPNTPEQNTEYLKTAKLPGVQILSDSTLASARRFRSYDDFEEIELHSTILIDKNGRVHWARTGGEPFMDLAFLTRQLERMNKANY